MNVDDVVARWRSEDEAVRARLSKSTGFASFDQVEGRSGIQWLEAIFSGELRCRPNG